jgi:DNA polymerase I-like protein with 3'-5' exonuclease and polymerase domains
MKVVTRLEHVPREEQLSWLGQPYAIDIESTGLDYVHDELIGVALYVNATPYYFVLKHTADDGETITDYLTPDELRVLLLPVMMQDVVACLHNSKFDLHFFRRYQMELLSRNFDTLMAAQLLNENRRNGLKELTSLVDEDMEHTKYEALAQYRGFPKGSPLAVPLAAFAEYAMKDVIVTFKLWQKFREELPKDTFKGKSVQDVFNKVWMPMIPVLQEMEAYGFKVDVPLSRQLREKYAAVAAENEVIVQKAGYDMLAAKKPEDIPSYFWKIIPDDELEDMYLDTNGRKVIDVMGVQTPVWRPSERSKWRRLHFNVASPSQLVDLILGELVLPAHAIDLTKSKTGEDSVNVENLEIIKYYLGDDTPYYIDALLKWRKAAKFISTYLDVFINKSDEKDRIHAFFSMAVNDLGKGGTRTGRLSSSGPNLQNIPSRGSIGDEARTCFIADEGNVIVTADYSNMETVVFAHFSQDPVLLKAFEEGLDVHSLTACGIHGLDYETFVAEYKNGNPEYDAMRRAAKTLLFGQAYGMGVYKLQRTLLVQNGQEYSIDEARKLLRGFNETYHVMDAWKTSVNNFAGERGFVPTILGRKRRLPLVFSRDPQVRSRAMRQGVNATIQGSCADILFQALIPIHAAFRAMGGSLVASVHDEIVAEVPEHLAEAAARTMEHLMVDQINPLLRCKLKAEAHWGKNWLEAKKG